MKATVVYPNDPVGRYLVFEYDSYDMLGIMETLIFRSSDLDYIKDLTSKIVEGVVDFSCDSTMIQVYDLTTNKIIYKIQNSLKSGGYWKIEILIDLINNTKEEE